MPDNGKTQSNFCPPLSCTLSNRTIPGEKLWREETLPGLWNDPVTFLVFSGGVKFPSTRENTLALPGSQKIAAAQDRQSVTAASISFAPGS